ncbi:MAG TPA: hypothetical protein DEH15_19250 [Marinilabiliales bacterium]|nr:hypothetical protein [Marinilabiliales bacterium]
MSCKDEDKNSILLYYFLYFFNGYQGVADIPGTFFADCINPTPDSIDFGQVPNSLMNVLPVVSNVFVCSRRDSIFGMDFSETCWNSAGFALVASKSEFKTVCQS